MWNRLGAQNINGTIYALERDLVDSRTGLPLGPAPSPIQVTTIPGDRTAPNTRIVSGPSRTTFKRLAKFRFASTEPQSRFQCKVDKSRWRRCRNPFKRKVSAGKNRGRKHVFKVRAIDRFGNVDKSPARFSWRVKKVGG